MVIVPACDAKVLLWIGGGGTAASPDTVRAQRANLAVQTGDIRAKRHLHRPGAMSFKYSTGLPV
jgi:hypothetical protein